MGDMTKFNSAIEYYIFNVLLMCLLISEIFIPVHKSTGIEKRICEFVSSYLHF